MGILGVIGVIVLLSAHYGGPIQVQTGWYYFWLVMAILNVVSMGVNARSK